jgi:hypothetical protein
VSAVGDWSVDSLATAFDCSRARARVHRGLLLLDVHASEHRWGPVRCLPIEMGLWLVHGRRHPWREQWDAARRKYRTTRGWR